MVVFALSCFGLLLFLWLSFGGPIPLKPKGYRVQVAFPEATPLGLEADVRVAGVSVGKVRQKTLDHGTQPHARDARDRPQVRAAAHRRAGDPAPEDAARRDLRRADAGHGAEEDPRGRAAARRAGQEDGRARRDLPLARPADARGVPRLAAGPREGDQRPRAGLQRRARHAARASPTTAPTSSRCSTPQQGAVTAARQEHRRHVRRADRERAAAAQPDHVGRARSSTATASQQDNLAETIRIFPTFLDESKATLARLQTFSTNTQPLVHDLIPVAQRPQADAARRARRCHPTCAASSSNLDPLIKASQHRPAGGAARSSAGSSRRSPSSTRSCSRSTRSCSTSRRRSSRSPTSSPTARRRSPTPSRRRSGGVGHYLRQFGPVGAESLAIYPRAPGDQPRQLLPPARSALFGDLEGTGIFPNYDCKPSGGEAAPKNGNPGRRVADKEDFGQGLQGSFPHVKAGGLQRGK